ncbi:MAG: hypothetical protein E6K29_16040 [Gammaproteobacteria bacterium]|nr:MAG: hypothetical protein E6K29_16040 [Gammaproteobacteria bacterium]
MIMAGGACTMQEPLPVDAALPALANAHYEALLPVERQAWFGLHRRAARISAGGSAASQAVRELGYGAQGNEVNRSLKSVWFAAPPSMGLSLKISSTVRSVELWS